MKPCMWALLYPISRTGLSRSDRRLKLSTWVGSCAKCCKTRKWTEGIFCTNFYKNIGRFPPCGKMWCGTCYTSSTELCFHVASLEKESGENGSDPDERERLRAVWGKQLRDPTDFHVGCRGDHIMTPFLMRRMCISKVAQVQTERKQSPGSVAFRRYKAYEFRRALESRHGNCCSKRFTGRVRNRAIVSLGFTRSL